MLKYLVCCVALLSPWVVQAEEISFSQNPDGDFFRSFSVGGPGTFSITISSTPYFFISNVYLDNQSLGSGADHNWSIQGFGLDGGNHTLTVKGSENGNGNVSGNLTFTPAVPEPETAAMLVVGLGVIGALARRNKNRRC
jgi:hypothetical protein